MYVQNPDNFELNFGKCMCQGPDNFGLAQMSVSLSGQFLSGSDWIWPPGIGTHDSGWQLKAIHLSYVRDIHFFSTENVGDKKGGSGYGFVLFEGKVMLAQGVLFDYGRKLTTEHCTIQCFLFTQNQEARTENTAGSANLPVSLWFHTHPFSSSNT